MINDIYQKEISNNEGLAKQLFDAFNILWTEADVETIYENSDGSEIYKVIQISNSEYYSLIKKDITFKVSYTKVPYYIIKDAKKNKNSIIKEHLFKYRSNNDTKMPSSYDSYDIFEFMKEENDILKISILDFYDFQKFNNGRFDFRIKIYQNYSINEMFFSYMLKNYNFQISEYEEANKKAIEKYSNELNNEVNDLFDKIHYIKNTIFANKIYHSNRFEWNDLDNHIWRYKNYLMMDNQNNTLYFDIIDEKNIKVYCYNQENCYHYSNCKKYEGKKDLALEIKDGKIIFAQPNYMYHIDIDLTYGLNVMKEKYGNYTPSVDVYSVDYIKNYYYTKYKYNRFDLLYYIFCCLGGSYEYNSNTGTFIDPSMKNIKVKKMPDEDIPTLKFELNDIKNNFYNKKITYLNSDWSEELYWFSDVLESNKSNISVNGATNEDEVKKFIFDLRKIANKVKPCE